MFKRKLNIDAFTNLICDGTVVHGELNFSGVLFFQGHFIGTEIKSIVNKKKQDDALHIDKSGRVSADCITATNVVISGTVCPRNTIKEPIVIKAEDTVRIHKSAVVESAIIYYRTLEIEPGARINSCEFKYIGYEVKEVSGDNVAATV